MFDLPLIPITDPKTQKLADLTLPFGSLQPVPHEGEIKVHVSGDEFGCVGIATTNHPTSSHGLPIIVIMGVAFGPADLPVGTRIRPSFRLPLGYCGCEPYPGYDNPWDMCVDYTMPGAEEREWEIGAAERELKKRYEDAEEWLESAGYVPRPVDPPEQNPYIPGTDSHRFWEEDR